MIDKEIIKFKAENKKTPIRLVRQDQVPTKTCPCCNHILETHVITHSIFYSQLEYECPNGCILNLDKIVNSKYNYVQEENNV
jgi:transposase